jgi:hypothetical protein
VKRSQRLDENASRIETMKKELARLERVLGTARLARYEELPEMEEKTSIARASLESLIYERLHLQNRAAEKISFLKDAPINCSWEIDEADRRCAFLR